MLNAVGWGRDSRNEGFGDQSGIKYQLVALITSVQTLLRGNVKSSGRFRCLKNTPVHYLLSNMCEILLYWHQRLSGPYYEAEPGCFK